MSNVPPEAVYASSVAALSAVEIMGLIAGTIKRGSRGTARAAKSLRWSV